MIDSSGVARNSKAAGAQTFRLTSRGGQGRVPRPGLTCTELLCKFPGEIEGNSSEVGVPQKVVQVVA